MSSDRILVPLADGFEEIEAVAIIDVLRRAELEVVVAGLQPGPVTGAHGITLETDASLNEVDLDAISMLCLPGGMPGTTNLMEDERILDLTRRLAAEGKPTTAICAAPMVLAKAGVVDGVPVTSHPTVRAKLGAAQVVDAPRVVESGSIVTSQGPGTSLEFALALVRRLRGDAVADSLQSAMLVAVPST